MKMRPLAIVFESGPIAHHPVFGFRWMAFTVFGDQNTRLWITV